MLLAEALAARKDAISEIDNLRDRLAAAALRYEDDDALGEQPAELVADLSTALDRFERLSVRINQTNNRTSISFDGGELSIMEAIALRDRLVREVKARRKVVEAVEEATGRGTGRRFFASRRTKDELREVPTIDARAERRTANELSERVRRLDLALQQRNWTTELLERGS